MFKKYMKKRKLEYNLKKQIEILELRNTRTKIKASIDRL